jgi:hypothetical protein
MLVRVSSTVSQSSYPNQVSYGDTALDAIYLELPVLLLRYGNILRLFYCAKKGDG